MSRTQWEAVLTLPVSEDRDHIQGPADAPVTLVEYGDYECPYCGAAYPIVKEVQARMGERLRFVFRNFPITTSHPHAEQAAEAAEAAALQGQVLGDARPALREPAAPGRRGPPRLRRGARARRRALRPGAGRARPRRPRPRGLHERRAERRERHADLLHRRCEARRLVRPRDPARCPGASCARFDNVA